MGFSLGEFLNLNNKQKQNAQHPQTPTTGQTQHPNFTFTGNPTHKPGEESFQFNSPWANSPAQTPQAQLPQNVTPTPLSLYSDPSGAQKWLEDENTGQKYPYNPPSPYGDFNVTPDLPKAQVPVQYQNNALRRIVRGYI